MDVRSRDAIACMISVNINIHRLRTIQHTALLTINTNHDTQSYETVVATVLIVNDCIRIILMGGSMK